MPRVASAGATSQLTRTGLVSPLAVATTWSMTASASGSMRVVSIRTIASIPGSPARMPSTFPNISGRVSICAVTSIGLRATPKLGISASTRFWAAGPSSGTSSPRPRHSSARIPQAPPEVEMMPTRRPAGGGCHARAIAASKSPRTSRTRTAPAARSAAVHTTSSPYFTSSRPHCFSSSAAPAVP